MNWLLSILSLVAPLQAAATPSTGRECLLREAKPDLVSVIPEAPSYFTKVMPDGKAAFYIGTINHLLLLEEKNETKRVLDVPGTIDPVPCPDGRVMSVPGLDLYEMSQVYLRGVNAPSMITDYTLAGVYQSCGLLESTSRSATYRIITDENGGVMFRDYRVTFGRRGRPGTAVGLGPAQARCPGTNLKTILISKTGKYISGFSPATGTTQIWDVSDEAPECKLALDLGFPTGKVEFNFDDSRIAFHMDYFGSNAGEYFSGLDDGMSKDVFTLDLERTRDGLIGKNMRRITAAGQKDQGSYYPSFARDGRIVFVNYKDDVYTFQRVNPDEVPGFQLIVPPPEGWSKRPADVPADWKERLHSASVVGSLWSERCSRYDEEVTAVDAATVQLSLTREGCRLLVREGWSPPMQEKLAKHVRFQRDTRFDPQLIRMTKASDLEQICASLPL
ncbi:MAG TPA: hypothetical protein PKC28_02630 [Bdellovibrionales bacterium]|nr:hypothetical protein [Bdellovibrionales bacterium]